MEKTRMSTYAGHTRRVLAPTPRFRGGAVPTAGSALAGDFARTGIPMV